VQGLGLKLAAIALCSLAVVAGWAVLSMVLGRAQEKRSAQLRVNMVLTQREFAAFTRRGCQFIFGYGQKLPGHHVVTRRKGQPPLALVKKDCP
jgi:hypothetical protein